MTLTQVITGLNRPYRLDDIQKYKLPIRTQYMSAQLSMNLRQILQEHQHNKTASVTYGIMDPVQLIQASPYIDTVYVSGWTCASTASTNNEPGPDFADYPSTTVPNKVEQLVKAQEHHQRRLNCQGGSRGPIPNLMHPIIADADTGFGGLTSVLKTTKMMIQAGAAGIHLEDQRNDAKKCGHLGGKVLVSTQAHIDRLVAARLQADLMDSPLVLVSRTDAESATHIDSNIDPRDHPFIVGRFSTPNWTQEMTFPEGFQRLRTEGLDPEKVEIKFDAEVLRSREGFYRVRGSTEYAIQRALSFAPYADMLWCETSKPSMDQAKALAEGILSKFPEMRLAYNLSPSFNWSSGNLSKGQLKDFSSDLAKLGFCWQFITLGGFHVNSLSMTRFARDFYHNRMLSYADGIQKAEKEEGVATFKHQQWSGVELTDQLVNLITEGGNICSSKGSTESKF